MTYAESRPCRQRRGPFRRRIGFAFVRSLVLATGAFVSRVHDASRAIDRPSAGVPARRNRIAEWSDMSFFPPIFRARAAFIVLVLAMFAPRADAAPDWLAVSTALVPHGSAIDFTPHGSQPGLFNDLQPSDSCGGCHGAGGGDPETAPTFRPYSALKLLV